jgi:hypothetical protein
MDAMEFFQRSSGKWRSQRTTHHLPFRRAESGESAILVKALASDDPQVIEICQLHEVDPSLAAGGCFVSWEGSMAWDKEDEENHQGTTVFVLVPDEGNPRQGQLLRERGYAEIMPVIGHYHIDDDGGLVLTTEYETMSAEERFSFPSPDIRTRTSTVKRFGGFSTASFCIETRIDEIADATSSEEIIIQPTKDVLEPQQVGSVLGW